MRKRRVIILAAAVVAVLGVIWWTAATRPFMPDPVYAGHPLSYWLDPAIFVGGTSPPEFQDLPTSLDSNALPCLVRALDAREGGLRMAYVRLRRHLPHRFVDRAPAPWRAGGLLMLEGGGRLRIEGYAWAESSWGVRANSCAFLGLMGAKARVAVPELIRLLREDDSMFVRFNAAEALVRIASSGDKDVAAALTAAVTEDKDGVVRYHAGDALSRFDPEAAAKAGVTNAATGTSSFSPSGAGG